LKRIANIYCRIFSFVFLFDWFNNILKLRLMFLRYRKMQQWLIIYACIIGTFIHVFLYGTSNTAYLWNGKIP
jgi:hypothetical protein